MINENMRLQRVIKKLSQQELADLVGVTRQTISLIETNQYNPSLQICIAICKALDTDLNHLFWEVNEHEKETS